MNLQGVCVFVATILTVSVSGQAQTIREWNIVASAPAGRDSCTIVKDEREVKAILTPAGWTTQDRLPPIAWKGTMILVTSADRFERPLGIGLSQDGTKILVVLEPTDQRNTGVFLLGLDGDSGSSNACALAPQNVLTETSHSSTTSSTAKTKTTTTTTTRARPD